MVSLCMSEGKPILTVECVGIFLLAPLDSGSGPPHHGRCLGRPTCMNYIESPCLMLPIGFG